jgi:MFS family permease
MESVFGLWAEDRYAWGAREVGISFMVVGIVSSLNQGLFTGRLARRFGEPRVLAFGMVLFGASLVAQVVVPREWTPAFDTAIGPWAFTVPQGWLVPVVMAFGACGMSLAMPNISAMISRATPPDRQGAMLGLNMASGSLARIGGPIAAGAMFSAIGHDMPFLVGAALTVPAAVMALNAGRVLRKAQAEAAAAPARPPAQTPAGPLP